MPSLPTRPWARLPQPAWRGVQHVHADVMSEPALALLKAHGIKAEYGQLVDHIINRAGTGWCPMEQLSRDIDDPATIIQKIKEFFNSH